MKTIIKIEDGSLILNHAAMLETSMVLEEFLASQKYEYKGGDRATEDPFRSKRVQFKIN